MNNFIRGLRKVKKLFISTFLLLLIITPQINSWISSSPEEFSTTIPDRYSQLSQEAEEMRKNGEFEKAIEVFDKLKIIAKNNSDKEKNSFSLF